MPSAPSPPPDLAAPPVSAQIERAWHLLTVLVRLGRPAPLAELAARCPPPSPTPDLVEILCGIPGSPLFLTDDGYVTVSQVAVVAFSGFLSRAIAPFVPRVSVGVPGERGLCSFVELVYERKRKVGSLGAENDLAVSVPGAKRRLIFPIENGVGEVKRCRSVLNSFYLVNSEAEATKKVSGFGDIVNNNILPVGTSTIQFGSRFLNQNCQLSSPLYNHGRPMSRFGSEKNTSTGGHNKTKSLYHNAQRFVIHEKFQEFHNSKVGWFDMLSGVSPSGTLISDRSNIKESEEITVCHDFTLGKRVELDKRTNILVESSCNKIANVPFKNSTTPDESDSTCPREPVVLCDKGEYKANTALLMENKERAAVTCSSAQVASQETKNVSKNILSFQEDNLTTGMNHFSKDIPLKATKQQTMAKDLLPKSLARKGSAIGLQSLSKLYDSKRDGGLTKDTHNGAGSSSLSAKQNKNHFYSVANKDKKEEALPSDPKSKKEHKLFPVFESYTIEEEEGSGGYGTVYRVKRKADGKVFAVKYPHANANLHYVNNEMKMLEQFGGRNFVIKYEGSFRTGESDCFVLEHVEHDRPEVLKKEINVDGIQWYGYCMFRALTSLHKQGIVHRDVKPGNFLFSRELNKGYLIDFNLASDLNQKFFKTSKSDNTILKSDSVFLTAKEQASCSSVTKSIGNVNLGSKEMSANESKKQTVSNMRKKRSNRNLLDAFPKIDSQNKNGSQTADSGITSTRDPTSTRTASADKLKQPIIPYRGRKELINFLHEAMQSPDRKELIAPASQRKRVAAPLAKVGRKLLRITPMPLISGGEAVAGAGMFKGKGNGKHSKEGPCVGTKGFRAPEVLLKSFHQGYKVDVWSAGVTLLYLMTGRAPFGGDPEQNLKDIAKLRGSEGLWEVAKLHNRETSYPSDLFDVKSLHSVDLREWCARNTKRPDFLDEIPPSLFDLVNKCLAVNPRCRITAEEALMHEFFVPCHESLKKQRMLRRATSSESGISFS